MTGRARRASTAPWSGTAFLVEACALLAFLVVSLAVLAALFMTASERGREADQLARAVVAARDAAERVCADPEVVGDEWARAGGLTVHVEEAPHKDGDPEGLLRATVVVTGADGNEVYRLETATFPGGDES